ncbi:hypothetical protein OK074_3242 [Actinobacteria bacterium OK074]|nr:hypothetical protein OK074_3242 [Actinobacteria bacterium OK074]
MAHVVPTPSLPGATPVRGGTSDVFGAREHRAAALAVPVAVGLVYGFWCAAIRRDGGPITGWNVLFGFVCALAFAAVWTGVRLLAPRLKREPHAVLWAAFAGVALGFVHSQTGASVLRSAFIAVALAVPVFLVLFYRYYTHEDAAGHRDDR